jgi:Glycosyltransferase family 10 (fucosyltransferase) C-term
MFKSIFSLRAFRQVVKCFIRKCGEIRQNTDIVFRDFWPKDDHGDRIKAFILDILSDRKLDRQQIYIYSNYQQFNRKMENAVDLIFRKLMSRNNSRTQKIWYTAENLRMPHSSEFDFHLTFDSENYQGKNVYLPLWIVELGKGFKEAQEMQLHLMQPREMSADIRKFACIVINNPEPVRMNFLAELQKLGDVDCFGKAFNKPIPNKSEVIENYNFNICFENDLYPGYITEKVVQAYLAGCIPIYYGLDKIGHLNSRAMVNVADIGFQQSLETISTLMDNRSLMSQMRNEPLISVPYDFDHLNSELKRKLSKGEV